MPVVQPILQSSSLQGSVLASRIALQLAAGTALVSIKAAQGEGYPIRSFAAILTWLDMAAGRRAGLGKGQWARGISWRRVWHLSLHPGRLAVGPMRHADLIRGKPIDPLWASQRSKPLC